MTGSIAYQQPKMFSLPWGVVSTFQSVSLEQESTPTPVIPAAGLIIPRCPSMAHALVLAAVLRQFQKTAIAMRSSFFPSMKQQTQPCLVQGIRSTPHILWRKGNIGGGQDLPYNCSNMRPHQNLSQKCQPTLWFTGCLVTHLVQKLRNPRTMVASVTRVTAMMNLHEGINASVIKAMMGTPTCLMGAKVCIFQCDYFALISNYLFTHG